MKKTLKKSTDKEPVKKPRKPRNDQAQKKPVFDPFTIGWGISRWKSSSTSFERARPDFGITSVASGWDDEAAWRDCKHEFGKFLHPLLVQLINRIQSDHRMLVSQNESLPSQAPSEASIFDYYHDLEAREQRGESLGSSDAIPLYFWKKWGARMAATAKYFGELASVAAACGDAAYFQHVALILESLREHREQPVLSERAAVLNAYAQIQLFHKMKAVPRDQNFKSESYILDLLWAAKRYSGVVALPTHIEIDTKLCESREIDGKLHESLPGWKERDQDYRDKMIRRICEDAGLPLGKV